MPNNPAHVQVIDNSDKKRFEARVDGHLAIAEYILSKSRIIFTHTEVPKALEGQGVGAQLAQTGLDYARQHHLRVMPLCPFIAAYMEDHPEYQDLLMPGFKLKTK